MRDLVELHVAPGEAVAALARFGWDSDEELCTLRRTDVVRVLDRYLRRQLTADECRAWAEGVEGREDVGLEAGYEELLKGVVFELATPELAEPLTPDTARTWVDALGYGGRPPMA